MGIPSTRATSARRSRPGPSAAAMDASVLENLPAGYIVLDENGRLQQANHKARSWLAWTEKVAGKARLPRLQDLLDPDHQAALARFLEQLRTRAETHTHCDIQLKSPPLHLRLNGRWQAATSNYSLIAQDISDLHNAHQQQQKQLDLYDDLTAHLPGILFQYQLSPEGETRFTFVSTAISRYYHISQDEAQRNGHILESRIHPEDKEAMLAAMRSSARELKQWHYEYRTILPDGEVVWRAVDAYPQKLIDGNVLWHGYTVDITERKHLELALREHEERCKLAIESTGDGVWDWDVKRNIVTYSDHWNEKLGQHDTSANGVTADWLERVHPEDRALTIANGQQLTDGTTERSEIEVRMRGPDGRWHWTLSRAVVVSRDKKGHPLRILGTNVEITRRKEMEDALRTNEERWKLALEAAGHGVWEWDLLTNAGSYSRRWKNILGYTDSEIANTADEWMSRTHPEDQSLIGESFRALLKGEKTTDSLEFRMRCKDGQWKWVLGSGILVTHPQHHGVLRIVGTLSDISERKHFELALQESEERWKFALEGAGDGVWDLNVERSEMTLSPRAGEILGLDPKAGLTQSHAYWISLLHPDDLKLAQKNRGQMGHDSNTSAIELRARHADGHWLWLLSRGMVVSRNENGKPRRIVGTVGDISARKATEEKLRLTLQELDERRQEAEKLAKAKTHFLNAASHDLRQPLYAAQLFADALAGERLTPTLKSITGNLRLALKAMTAQLEMLLDLSRFDLGKLQPQLREVPLSRILREIEVTYSSPARQAGVSLHVRPGPELNIITDPVLLCRLLGNLVDNAIKFASHGRILVCARLENPGSPEGSGLRLEVRDNGKGIAPEHLQKIFDEYFQVGNPERDPSAGLGLGLSIVRRITVLLDIPLTLKSSLGRGTVFAVSLPAEKIILPQNSQQF